MLSFSDQLGRTVSLSSPPGRIVSLVPSQTELLYDLGLEEEVIGITRFCVHPEQWFRSKIRVGGTKKLNIDKIRSLQPDLIIGNKEENEKGQIEILMKEFSVWMSDIKTREDAYGMIRSVGEIVGRKEKAEGLIARIRKGFEALYAALLTFNPQPETPNQPSQTRSSRPETLNPQPETAYLIWRNPWMAAGGGTFIDEMLKCCGLKNIFGEMPRYPETDPARLMHLSGDMPNVGSTGNTGRPLILLSSEPYPFRGKHIAELREILPAARILLVDGEMFSWYGSRMEKAAGYFRQLLPSLYSSR